MTTKTLEEAKSQLDDLINAAAAGEEVFITRDEQLSVQLVPHKTQTKKPRIAGSAKGLIVMADDFDEPLEDFKEYME